MPRKPLVGRPHGLWFPGKGEGFSERKATAATLVRHNGARRAPPAEGAALARMECRSAAAAGRPRRRQGSLARRVETSAARAQCTAPEPARTPSQGTLYIPRQNICIWRHLKTSRIVNSRPYTEAPAAAVQQSRPVSMSVLDKDCAWPSVISEYSGPAAPVPGKGWEPSHAAPNCLP